MNKKNLCLDEVYKILKEHGSFVGYINEENISNQLVAITGIHMNGNDLCLEFNFSRDYSNCYSIIDKNKIICSIDKDDIVNQSILKILKGD